MGLANFYSAATNNLQKFGKEKVRPVLKKIKQDAVKRQKKSDAKVKDYYKKTGNYPG